MCLFEEPTDFNSFLSDGWVGLFSGLFPFPYALLYFVLYYITCLFFAFPSLF